VAGGLAKLSSWSASRVSARRREADTADAGDKPVWPRAVHPLYITVAEPPYFVFCKLLSNFE